MASQAFEQQDDVSLVLKQINFGSDTLKPQMDQLHDHINSLDSLEDFQKYASEYEYEKKILLDPYSDKPTLHGTFEQ